MPRRISLIRVSSAFALVLVLAGCTKGGQFDPTEIFNNDAFDTKKKLKGDREAVFPNGVPGATTGVPPDLVKGYQPPPDPADAAAAPGSDTAAKPPSGPAPKVATTTGRKTAATATKPKPKSAPKVAATPAQGQDPIWNQTAAPKTRISVGSPPNAATPSTQAPWPSPQAPAQQTSQSVWPASPSPGKASQ